VYLTFTLFGMEQAHDSAIWLYNSKCFYPFVLQFIAQTKFSIVRFMNACVLEVLE